MHEPYPVASGVRKLAEISGGARDDRRSCANNHQRPSRGCSSASATGVAAARTIPEEAAGIADGSRFHAHRHHLQDGGSRAWEPAMQTRNRSSRSSYSRALRLCGVPGTAGAERSLPASLLGSRPP